MNQEFYHFGIKGQKWGVRRYQNKNGSLTPEGEARYYNKDGSLTKDGRIAKSKGQLSYKVQREHMEKLHDSKLKKADDPDVNYFSMNATKGEKYVKSLSKQLLNGSVTSFVEDDKGNITYKGKTKKGVVVRDADGNRVTLGDYDRAQQYVLKYSGRRINTGEWS